MVIVHTSQVLWLRSFPAQGFLKFALERVVRRPKKPPERGKVADETVNYSRQINFIPFVIDECDCDKLLNCNNLFIKISFF